MTYTLVDSKLKIYASEGIITVWADDFPDRVEELSLTKLEKVYKKWQHLIKEIGENIAQELFENKKKREEIFSILKEFGFKRYRHFTASQIKALLFLYDKGHSIMWRFHSVYPTLDLPVDEEDNLDYGEFLPGLSPFETAQFYLLQNDSLKLAEDMPLSKVMKLFVSKAFISWVSIPENKAKIRQKQFEAYVDENPLNPDDILRMMKKG